ncbi:unnamed protein product, partial [Staurois parvus]
MMKKVSGQHQELEEKCINAFSRIYKCFETLIKSTAERKF